MTETLTTIIPVFYACASADPEGPPLEIAWAFLAYDHHVIISEARLIRPPAAWISEVAQNTRLSEAYGLSLAELREFGSPPREIAALMNEVLAQRELFSALPEDDSRLRRMFVSAKMAPEFALRRSNADELIAELAQLRRLPTALIARAERQAEIMSPTSNRAEARARYLATLWTLIARQN
jgi:hypothetical protein